MRRFGCESDRYITSPRGEKAGAIERWTLVGPQTWDERKWQRIASSRPFATAVETAKPRLRA